MHYFKRLPYLFYFLVSFHFLAVGQAADSHQNLSKDKLALSGYDVVEYHNDTAVKGKAAFESTHQGGKYRFSSLKSKLLFEKNPEKYLPQYGGWCAYAMAYSGEKVPINPESFSIENGKLYLFYKTFFNDTKAKWTENTAALKEKADKNWINLLKTSKNENKN
ncbi:MAG: YHS domain-containing (seleno)protein [Flavobacteriaceae bacterium]